jgi:CHAT domain-containing protein
MLTYLVTDTASVVFVVTRDTLRVIDLHVARAGLASLIDFTRGALTRTQSASTPWRVPLRRLYQQLIAPVEAAGMLAGIRQLTIVPHGELHYLPFAALIREGNGGDEFLVERFDVGYAPSASVFTRLGARAAPPGRRVLALAPRPNQLPGARDEVEAIRATYGSDATVLIGPQASEQAFRSAAESHGIVHLATYGVLNQHNPLFSFVELTASGADDGRLEVHEVFGLSLNARLLVLSACQTGLASGAVSDVPSGDDWVGLVRAFLSAGAANVIATLWAVEDRATAGLMQRLHVRLRARDSEVVALSDAQRRTLRNPATSNPFYWAGFVLVGGS